MASLAHVIRDFQSGALTQDAFVAQLDSTLTTEGVGSARLLEILGEAHVRKPLPPALYAEVRRRIEQMPVSNLAAAGGEETRMQTVAEPPPTPQPARGGDAGASGSGLDQVKGTGDTLNNRFVLEDCLGVGGMGTVYKALDLRKLEASDRKPYLAIKVLNTQFRGNPKSLIALQREARKAQVLAHRNIVTVYDFDRDGAIVYLTMEYLSGKPLSQILRTQDFKGMPVQSALPIVRGMSSALAYAHERGFVHCDFKPANVFLTDTGEVKVIDFGIARVFQRPEEESDATVFDPGSLGALTPAYASPEMLEHLEPDPRDDIYALGCITYELLTGRHPFDRQSATQARASNRQPQRPENLSNRQWRALRATLAFDRKSRTPTVSRFVEEFGAQERPSASNSSGRNVDRTGMLVKSGVAGLALACAAGGALYFYRASRTLEQENAALQVSQASDAGSARPSASATLPVQPVQPITPVTPSVPAAASAPSAPVTAAPPTLAAVTSALATLPCSALAASIQERAVKVRGFVPQHGEAQVNERLAALPGVASTKVDVQHVSSDKCEVLKELGSYWTRNWQAGHIASLTARMPNGVLTEGDPLVVDVRTPGYDSYVNIDYYVLDGSVVHMVPGPRAKDNQAPAHYSATIGSGGDWIVSKPFGQELVVLLITPAPLFDAPRPESESRADYLRALDTRLKQLAAKYGQDHIVADFAQITSKARAR
ncbi:MULTISPECIES: serine/threonine protein kinase [Paraburkholderia]|uniref:Protein kinase n=1 Tax=Paraburkholderia caribensis TaxID=75105 RepID=A0A9Q6S5J1_9BURK|nr:MULTISPECIES: serine/threonine protein kinase [Paraburkholderia]AMV46374.1 protein kinase [Paraburkholderia caribensis]MCO4876159.1 serine/threonine-protein kinase [Paraburkholderia caribensis]PTB22983.1 protein kinase [Paraburkholderia caribensis]QLB64811.1 protein kinase [Paraburkholderia caribensis]